MEITPKLIESLLKEDEGIALDFKSAQYPFVNASDEKKSELLKDLIAFCNTTRTRAAFILIGADESNRDADGSAEVYGINYHLPESNVQQFVNGKTNRHMRFTYRRVPFAGKQIGVLQIPIQKRPVYSKSDYGKVKRHAVYCRSGSSTRIALPEEIHLMGQEDSNPQQREPELSLGFFNRKSDEQYGPEVTVTCTWIDMPSRIPNYPVRNKNDRWVHLDRIGPMYQWNSSYLRELAEFTRAEAFLQPVSMSLFNSSSVTAVDVRLVLEVEDTRRDCFFSIRDDMPKKPSTNHDFLHVAQTINLPADSKIDIDRKGENWQIEVRFGKVQSGSTVQLDDDLLVASMRDGLLPVKAKLFADNLGSPREIEVAIRVESLRKDYTLDDLAQAHEPQE